jgi:two-component system nitrate/nitrite response regulator NarL
MTIRVAIVDDHRLVREGLTKVLDGSDGIEVVGACGLGSEALELCTSHRPGVLLLDIVLPDVDGLSLIEAIRSGSPDTRILMLSMHSEPEYAAAAVARGAAGLLGKDVAPESLVDAIRTVASGGALPVHGALTPREREILAGIAAGRPNGEIASDLGIAEKTVAGHCERMMEKLNIHTRAGLVAYARRIGL